MTKITDISKVPVDKGCYIAGFVDGEGSFYLSIRKREDYKCGWKFTPSFTIGNNDKVILEICKQHFGCGAIRNSDSRKGFYTYEVTDQELLETMIIPFFKRFRFLSSKKKHEFRVFQVLLTRVKQDIKTTADLDEVLVLRKELGKFRSDRFKNTDEIIRSSFQSKT